MIGDWALVKGAKIFPFDHAQSEIATNVSFALRAKLATVSDFVRIFVVPLFVFLSLFLAPLRAEKTEADNKITVPPLSLVWKNVSESTSCATASWMM